MPCRVKTVCVLTLAAALCSFNARAWDEQWNTTGPYKLSTAIASNGIGATISNNTGAGIKFFNANTGETLCTSVPDINRYWSNKSIIRATENSNLFLAYFTYRTAPNSPNSRLNIWAYRINPPVNGEAVSCETVWTWESPFTVPFNYTPYYTGFLAKDGRLAGLIVGDPTGGVRLRTYSIHPDTGATMQALDDPWVSNFSESSAGASANARYVYVGGSWARSLNPDTKLFGTKLISSGAVIAAAMSDTGYFIENGMTSTVVKHDNLDPTYNILVTDYSSPVPAATPYCMQAAISPNGQVGAIGCVNQAASQTYILSFAVLRGVVNHALYPINGFSMTSQTSYQFQPRKMVASNRGKIFFSTSGDSLTESSSAPEAGVLPISGAPVLFQSPGSSVDVYAIGNKLWLSYTATHENTAANGNYTVHYVNDLQN